MDLMPYSRNARTVLGCEKWPFLREFLDEPDTLSCHSSGPWDLSEHWYKPRVSLFEKKNTYLTIVTDMYTYLKNIKRTIHHIDGFVSCQQI